MKNCIMNDRTKWLIAHYHSNIIQLTGTSDSNENEVSSSDEATELKVNKTKETLLTQ